MRIPHKIFLGYLIIVGVCVVLVFAFLLTLFDLKHQYSNLVTRDQQVLLHTSKLKSSVEKQIDAMRAYEQLGSTSLLADYNSALQEQQQACDAIMPLVAGRPNDRAAFQAIQTARADYNHVAEQSMHLSQARQWQEFEQFQATRVAPMQANLLNKLDSFIQDENDAVDRQQTNLENEVQDASTRLLFGAMVGILAALLAATLLTEGITSPLRRLMRNVQRISSGDLQTAISVRTGDEIGQLAAFLETMRQSLAAALAEHELLLASAREEADKLAQTRMELEKANTELEEALVVEYEARRHIEGINRLKSEFTSMVSHELKTPVSYVYNYAAALKEHNESLNEGQRREFLTAIQGEAQHLLTLIDDIMAVSLLEAGGLKYRFVQTDLRSILDSVVKDQQLTTRRHTLTIKGPDSLMIEADPNRIKQVLNNLLSNAIKYSPQGGHVELRLRTNPGDGTALIYVRDNGLGIRPADVPKLFDRFTRIQRKETMAIPGSGLGLYIAHQIVDAHGGSLSLEPAPGKGTIAQVTLPILHNLRRSSGTSVADQITDSLIIPPREPAALGTDGASTGSMGDGLESKNGRNSAVEADDLATTAKGGG